MDSEVARRLGLRQEVEPLVGLPSNLAASHAETPCEPTLGPSSDGRLCLALLENGCATFRTHEPTGLVFYPPDFPVDLVQRTRIVRAVRTFSPTPSGRIPSPSVHLNKLGPRLPERTP